MRKKQKHSFHNIIPKILVVTPKANDRNFFQAILSFQYKTEAVAHGNSAINILTVDPEFNLVIICNCLPDMQGHKLFDSLKNDYPWIKPIIFYASESDSTEEVFPLNTYTFSKPIDVEFLLKTIKEILVEQTTTNITETYQTHKNKSNKRSGYTILNTIATGNIGKVELVAKGGKKYAMKSLQKTHHQLQFRALEERFNREAEVLLKINHPCVVKVFEHNPQNPAFIVMEYIEGGSLFEHINNQSLNFAQKLSIIKELSTALAAIHKIGILHRDIKPDNVLLTKKYNVKLTDFGIAGTLESDLTLTGEVIGSPSYMAPETFASMKNIDNRADIFSLGVLSYELLTGELPFKGNSVIETMNAIQTITPISPKKLIPTFPKSLEKVLNKMLKKTKKDRYQNAEEILKDLRKIAKQ